MRTRLRLPLSALALLVGCFSPNRESRLGDGGTDGGTPGNGIGAISCLSIDPDPPHLDFGTVVVGSMVARNLAIANHCGGDVDLTIGDLQGPDLALFTVVPPAGTILSLKDGDTRSLALTYHPVRPLLTQSQAYFALSVCSASDDCSAQVVLQGIGAATGLVLAPPALHFGFVPLNQTLTKTFTLTNDGNTTIHLVSTVLSAADGGPPGGGSFQPGAGFPSSVAALLPGQSVPVPIAFTPSSAAFFAGQLDVATDDPGSSLVTLSLDGYGGGPSISCTPTVLDFGQNDVGVATTLSTLCTNVGVDVPGHPEANLIFPDPGAVPRGVPFQNQDPSFQASFDAAPPTQGLAAGQSARVDVRYKASVAGTERDTLLIASNDAANPPAHIALTGTALSLADCVYRLNPTSGLAFGHIRNGASAVLPFEVVNQGTDACLLKNLQISAGTDPAFSLPDHPAATNQDVMLAAGSRLSVNVQVAPTSVGNLSGSATFLISDRQASSVVVPLSASSLAGCLVFQPSSIDFGVQGYDPVGGTYCSAASQTVTIFNLCETQNVTVNSLQVFDLASPTRFEVIGDPSPVSIPALCPSYQVCPPTSPATFYVSFSPTQTGLALGGIKISSSDLSDPYLFPLRGEATQNTARTDAFTAHAAELDLLWVFDTQSYSWSVVAQQAIAGDLSNFLAYPQQNGIDVHIATTSTDVYANASSEDGRMEPCTGCKVDGPAMQVVTLANELDSAVSELGPLSGLGNGGTCSGASCNGFGSEKQLFEATYEALSPAQLAGHNQPFYRDEAALAVISVIGDSEDDMSNARSLSAYYDAFIAVKGAQRADQFSWSRVSNLGGVANNQRTSKMAQVTGGIEADFASFSSTVKPSWTDQLNGLWSKVGPQLLNYPLTATPVPSSISVSDNGISIPPTGDGGVANWTYDAKANALRFGPAVVTPGDALQISYSIACGN